MALLGMEAFPDKCFPGLIVRRHETRRTYDMTLLFSGVLAIDPPELDVHRHEKALIAKEEENVRRKLNMVK